MRARRRRRRRCRYRRRGGRHGGAGAGARGDDGDDDDDDDGDDAGGLALRRAAAPSRRAPAGAGAGDFAVQRLHRPPPPGGWRGRRTTSASTPEPARQRRRPARVQRPLAQVQRPAAWERRPQAPQASRRSAGSRLMPPFRRRTAYLLQARLQVWPTPASRSGGAPPAPAPARGRAAGAGDGAAAAAGAADSRRALSRARRANTSPRPRFGVEAGWCGCRRRRNRRNRRHLPRDAALAQRALGVGRDAAAALCSLCLRGCPRSRREIGNGHARRTSALLVATFGPARLPLAAATRALEHSTPPQRHQDVTHAGTSKSHTKSPKFAKPIRARDAAAALSHLSCSFASGAARHVWSCRDKSRLKLAAPCARPVAAPHPRRRCTRPGPGSKNASLFFAARRGCAQYGLFHDTLARDLLPHQPKVVCARAVPRARSLLGHRREYFGPTPRCSAPPMDDFATFLGANWGAITATPWPSPTRCARTTLSAGRRAGAIDGCTRDLLLPPRSPAARRADALPPPRRNRTAADGGSGWCGAVRRLYAEDAALHDAYCAWEN